MLNLHTNPWHRLFPDLIVPMAFLLGLFWMGCHDEASSSNSEGSDGGTTDAMSQDVEEKEAEGFDAPEDGGFVSGTLEELANQYCSRMATVHCDNASSCGCSSTPGFPSDCESRYEASCGRWLERFRDGVNDGSIVVHLEAVDGCIEYHEKLASRCALPADDLFFADCPILAPRDGFGDRVGLGEECGPSFCEEGLRCGSSYRCVKPAQQGEACLDSVDCDPALSCVQERCVGVELPVVGASCMSQDECEPGLHCLASAKSVCRSTVLGESCSGENECSSGTVCATSSEGTDGSECMEAPTQGLDCLEGVYCAEGLACVEDRCAPKPQQGEDCALGLYGPTVCAEGLSCVAGLCQAPPVEGENCALGEPHCAAGLGCAFEGADNICRERKGVGEACENDDTCLSELHCNFKTGVCEEDEVDGSPCVLGNECGQASACLPDESFELRCAPKPKQDEACIIDECVEGLACRRVAEHGACAPAYCAAFLF